MTWLTNFLVPPFPHSHWTMLWHGLVFATCVSLISSLIGIGVMHLLWKIQDSIEDEENK